MYHCPPLWYASEEKPSNSWISSSPSVLIPIASPAAEAMGITGERGVIKRERTVKTAANFVLMIASPYTPYNHFELPGNHQCFRGYKHTAASPISRQTRDAAKRTAVSRSV